MNKSSFLTLMVLHLQLDDLKVRIWKVRLSKNNMLSEDWQLSTENSSHLFTANPIRNSTKMSVRSFLKSKILNVQIAGEANTAIQPWKPESILINGYWLMSSSADQRKL